MIAPVAMPQVPTQCPKTNATVEMHVLEQPQVPMPNKTAHLVNSFCNVP